MINKTIICGVIAGALTYAFLYYRTSNDDKNKNKKIDLRLPLITGLLCWFVSGKFINFDNVKLPSITKKCPDKTVDLMNSLTQAGGALAAEPLIEELADF